MYPLIQLHFTTEVHIAERWSKSPCFPCAGGVCSCRYVGAFYIYDVLTLIFHKGSTR